MNVEELSKRLNSVFSEKVFIKFEQYSTAIPKELPLYTRTIQPYNKDTIVNRGQKPIFVTRGMINNVENQWDGFDEGDWDFFYHEDEWSHLSEQDYIKIVETVKAYYGP